MKNYLNKANFAFDLGNYEEALDLYLRFGDEYPSLRNIINYNAKLAYKRMNSVGTKRIFLKRSVTIGILTTLHCQFLAQAIGQHLWRRGFDVEYFHEAPIKYPLDYYFVLCPQMFNSLPPGEKRIVFQLEQSTSDRWIDNNYLQLLENSSAVIDYSLENIRFLKTKGISYPLVYHLPLFPITLEDQEQKTRDIDVLFYGDSFSCERRRLLLGLLEKQFNVVIENNLFGVDLWSKLKRTKVVINLHYYENALLETPRLMESLSHGAMVISELARDSNDYPELAGPIKYFVSGDGDGMMDAVRDALKKPTQRSDFLTMTQKGENRFYFMLDRILIGANILSPDVIPELTCEFPIEAESICLSMPETIDRRDSFSAPKETDIVIFDGIRKSPGWQGCALSYRVLAEKLSKLDRPWSLIMEDDVVLPSNYGKQLITIKKFLDQTEWNWSLFSGLIAHLKEDVRVVDYRIYEGTTFLLIDRMTSTVFNIYRHEFLKTLLAWDFRNMDPESNTIDRYIENLPNLRVVTTVPFLVGHKEEVHSSLWNFKNTQYTSMIEESERLLSSKLKNFLKKH
jgi:hypothetical protein